jgi:hypothetical protein
MKYVVCYVDYGETCDGHPRVGGIFDTKEEAEHFLKTDMDSYKENLEEQGFTKKDYKVDTSKNEIWMSREIGFTGCVWSICEA